ncbi:unnamed protein product [Staurois parvus]|uniref:Uncharacterized protein n=1 Tax=Staurois parvus TaxID=386267 RepID=A0ABN9DL78_9NEOB|nr:unnamed protein product [Staurois parvus]
MAPDTELVYWDQQGRTDHLETRALPEGPGVSRGPHEMPLVPFS